MKINFPIVDDNVRQASHALYKKAEQGEINTAINLSQAIYHYGLSAKKSEGTLFVALKVLETLALRVIQDESELVYLLSKTSRLFLEKTCWDFARERKGITPLTREEIRTKLADVFFAIPSQQIGTQFQLLCCEEIRKRLQPGQGLAQDIARCHGLSFVKGGLEASAAINPLPLISPVLDLGVRAYQEIRHPWYSAVSRLHQLAVGILNIENFNNNLKNEIDKNPKTVEQAFCITELFVDILQNSRTEQSLKTFVLTGNSSQDTCLRTLASFQLESKLEKYGKILKIDLSWKVRYRVVECLPRLAKTDIERESCARILIDRQIHEKNANIKILVLQGLNQTYTLDEKEQELARLEATKNNFDQVKKEVLKAQKELKSEITKQGYQENEINHEQLEETDKSLEGEDLSYQLELLESEINNISLQIQALKDVSTT